MPARKSGSESIAELAASPGGKYGTTSVASSLYALGAAQLAGLKNRLKSNVLFNFPAKPWHLPSAVENGLAP